MVPMCGRKPHRDWQKLKQKEGNVEDASCQESEYAISFLAANKLVDLFWVFTEFLYCKFAISRCSQSA